MQPFSPDFEIVKMNAEIGAYQEDQDPERETPDVSPAKPELEATLEPSA
jgi:hypothetical protein